MTVELPSTIARARVLIVDDQPANVELLTRLLRSAGIDAVHGINDPREAVRRCLELRADLMLLDLHMPHMDGFAVMSALREALPNDAFIPVLVLTADAAGPTRDRALRAGAKDFVTKPFDRNEVILRVRNLLETRALYADVQRHNAALRADLAARVEREQRVAEERRQRTIRIDEILTGEGPTMVFQPIVDLVTGNVVGVEALARFHHAPHRPPNEWFAEAASVDRGAELELVAVSAALRRLGDVPSAGFLSVNISAATAVLPELAHLLEQVPGRRVVVELTEHARIDDYERVLDVLAPLRRDGVRVAVDDAGAGYAGLRHILSLRPDILKLDIDLTRRIDVDPARRALAAALVWFSHEIDGVVIAEGVEAGGELATVRGLGVPWAQGHYLAKPGDLPVPESFQEIGVNR